MLLGAWRALASPSYLVFSVYWVAARPGVGLKGAQLSFCEPATGMYHQVYDVAVLPSGATRVTDPNGNGVWRVDIGRRGHGRIRAAAICVCVRPLEAAPSRSGSPSQTLSERARDHHTRDGPALRMPATAALARQIAGGASTDGAKVRAAYRHVVEKFVYDRDGRWDPADVVLARQSGSCTELSYLLVSLCRNLGVPARLVRATAHRVGKTPYVDVIHHTWSEYFSLERGWVPVDCSRGLLRPEAYFGRQDRGVLATVGDASPEPEPGRCRPVHVEAPGEDPAVDVVSLWLAARRRSRDMEDARRMLRACEGRGPEDLTRMLGRLRRKGSRFAAPAALCCLLRADPAVFTAAARALAESGVPGALAALVHFRLLAGPKGRGDEAMQWVRRAATDGSPARRGLAARDLGLTHVPEAESILVRTSRDADGMVRARTAASLGRVGRSDEARQALERLASDRDAKVAEAAREALADLNLMRKVRQGR